MKISSTIRTNGRYLRDRQEHSGRTAGGGGPSDLPASLALVPVAPAAPRQTRPAARLRAAAPFLAQLAATRLGLPQTRARRRAGVTETVYAYETAARLDRRQRSGITARKII